MILHFPTQIDKNAALGWCVILTVLLFMSLLLTPYLNILTLGISLLLLFWMNVETSFCILLYLMSFMTIFKLQLDGFALFNLLLVAFMVRLVYRRFSYVPLRTSFAILLFGAYAFVITFPSGMADWIMLVVTLLMASLLMASKIKQMDLPRLMGYAAAGLIVSSTLALFRVFIPRLAVLLTAENEARIKLGPGLYFYRFSGLMRNPNIYTVLPSVLLAVYAVFFLRRKLKPVEIAFVVAMLIFGLMSASMSFVLSLGVLAVLIILELTKGNLKQRILSLSVLTVVFIVIYSLRNLDFIVTVIYRISSIVDGDSRTYSSITTGRTDIWLMYFDYFRKNIPALLFGAGFGVNGLEVVGREAHNLFIEVTFYVGILGLALYLYALWEIFEPRQFTQKKIPLLGFIPFAVLLVRTMARNLMLNEQFIFCLLLSAQAVVWSAEQSERAGKSG
ncbi:MAG: O-antigen ligase family protein [bacterium]